MSKNNLAEGQGQSLKRRIHRRIGRMKENVKGFQMRPHGMSGIGEASVGKGIAGQQEAELIVDDGMRNWQPGQQRKPDCERGETANQNAQGASSSHRCQCSLGLREPGRAELRAQERQQQRQRDQQRFRSYMREHE